MNSGGQIDDIQIFDSQEKLIKGFSLNELDLVENSDLLKYHYIAICITKKIRNFCQQSGLSTEELSSFFSR